MQRPASGWPLAHRSGGRTITAPSVLRTSSPTSYMSPGVPPGNRDSGPNVEVGMDDDERRALRTEGLDPDDPAVAAAIDMVRWELSLCAHDYDGAVGRVVQTARGADPQRALVRQLAPACQRS